MTDTTHDAECAYTSDICGCRSREKLRDENERLRNALEYLRGQFEFEVHQCEVCGNADPMNDCDSALWLKEFLTPNAQVQRRPSEARTSAGTAGCASTGDDE